MPIPIAIAGAIAIRYIIMAAVQLGIWWAIEKYGIPLINSAVVELMQAFGLTEQEAKDVMANKLIIAFEEVGIFAITLKSKLPIKVAELLGFTSKGFAIRKLSLATEAKIAGLKIPATSKLATTSAEAVKIAEVVGKSRGFSIPSFATFTKVVTLIIGVPTGFFFALAQYIDFANWQGPYQRYFQNLLSYIGINPDTPMPKASVVSADIWKRIYSTIEELGPIGLSFPFENADRPYSRQNLADLVDSIAANMVKAGGTASYKNVIGSVLLLVNLTTKTRTEAEIDAIFAKLPALATKSSGGGTSVQVSKVFTGIVSQGVVGAGLVFSPRPDDMIESVEELKQAASNNLAPFLNALLGKIVYEVKVVASIITKEGFKQSGTTQRIQTGTFANGQPKYKTVTNKFATLVVYALTDKGSRAKLTTIVLGPTDSAKLTVAQNDLRTLEGDLPALVTTNDISEITNIKNTTDKFSQITGEPNPDYITPKENVVSQAPTPSKTETQAFNPIHNILPIRNGETWAEYSARARAQKKDTPANERAWEEAMRENGYKIGGAQSTSVPATAPVVSSGGNVATKPGANATTLFEWYQAQGREVPPVAQRSVVYASLGLGVQGYYTGTAEQNTKLLNALKYQAS